MRDVKANLDAVMRAVGNPREGLPIDVFRFVSQLTPLVNVDLLLANDAGQHLLTWRDDEFYGPGWHVPGGIIRFKESVASRIGQVAKQELGADVSIEAGPIVLNEVMAPHRDIRGHFIALLYRCVLQSPPTFAKKASGQDVVQHGQWMWHDRCPDNLIAQHEMYRKYLDGTAAE